MKMIIKIKNPKDKSIYLFEHDSVTINIPIEDLNDVFIENIYTEKISRMQYPVGQYIKMYIFNSIFDFCSLFK